MNLVTIAAGLQAGAAGIPVIGMLVAASVIGGFATPVGMVLLILLARDPQIMGTGVVSRPLALAGWAVAVIVAGFGPVRHRVSWRLPVRPWGHCPASRAA